MPTSGEVVFLFLLMTGNQPHNGERITMKTSDLQIGNVYNARVSGKVTTVVVDNIVTSRPLGYSRKVTRVVCTNQATGRVVTFRSAAKFLSVAQ